MIPGEAVEAAFEVSLHQLGLWGKELPGALENARRARITELLEAAAPYMIAQALEDAAQELRDGPLQDWVNAMWLRARAAAERGGE